MFLRKSTLTREPLPLAMIGVRMGERVLQIGAGDVSLVAALASKPGISGHAAIVVHDDAAAARAQSAAADAGTLLEVRVVSDGAFPFADDAFDVAIVHGMDGTLAWDEATARATLAECHRVLRSGGRIIVLERGTPTGVRAWFPAAPKADGGAGARTIAALEGAGFKGARLLADREGYRFSEGLKR